MIEKLNRRVTIISEGDPVKDQYGGLTNTDGISWSMWAQVENRTGFPVTAEQQMVYNYDYKITVRFEKTRLIKSNYTVEYEGEKLSIKEIQIKDEGSNRFRILRCQKTDGLNS